MSADTQSVRETHWAKSRNLTVGVLVAWFIFGFVVPWFAKELNSASFLGFPLGYYFCVQGSLIIFVALIFFQNFMQDKIDEEAGITEGGTGPAASGMPAATATETAAAAPEPEPASASPEPEPAPEATAAEGQQDEGSQDQPAKE